MANVISIVISGQDLSGPAARAAGNNIKSLGQQGKQLGRVFSDVGQLAVVFGNKHIAGVANQTTNLIAIVEGLAVTMTRMSLRTATAIGALVAAVGFGVSKYLEMKEAADKAKEANKELTDVMIEMNVAAAKFENNGVYGDEAQIRLQFLKRIDEINKLALEGAKTEDIQNAQKRAEELRDMQLKSLGSFDYRRVRGFQEQLEQNANQGRFENFKALLDSEEALEMQKLEGRKEMISAYKDFWIETHRTMFSYAAEGSRVISANLSDAVVDVITRTKSASEAFRELGMSIARMFLQWIVNRAVAFAAEKALAALGLTLALTMEKTVTVIAASTAAAWAPAATASLIATFGSSASAATLLLPAMVANQAAATGLSLAGGAAHGGMEFIPRDTTIDVARGERVISPTQNEDLTRFLRAGGGRGGSVYIDGRKLGELLNEMSKDGRLRIDSRAIES